MTVHLVGAGPGDPGLITAHGLDLIRSCDVLVHDRLVAAELVAETPPHAGDAPGWWCLAAFGPDRFPGCPPSQEL